MKKVIYYVASSLDGFIAGENDNVHIEKRSIARIKEVIESSKTDVYLCGGG